MEIPTLPSPPTDNLYKFMALSGIVLLIVAPYFWAKFYVSEIQSLNHGFETLREDIPPYDYFMFKAQLNAGQSSTEEQKKLVEKFDAARKEAIRAMVEVNTFGRFSNVVTGLAIFLGLLGLGLTWFGFRLWYLRVQKPLDTILRKEARKTSGTVS